MSEPKRYTGKTEGSLLGSPHWEQPEGEWVKWEDYARLKALTVEMDKTINISQAGCRELKAEVKRLTNNCDYLDQKLDEELDKSAMLCGQIERLTKAGDELHAFLINYIVESRISSAYLNKLDDGWEAAKEGKQP